MKWLSAWWARWRLEAAEEDLRLFQDRCDVGCEYLCNLLQHRTELEWRLRALRT